jgi:phage shock protein C
MLRPRGDRVFAGVCSGIASYFGWEPALVRVIFALVAVAFAPIILAYFVLWISMPNEPLPQPVAAPAVAAPRRRSLLVPAVVVLFIAAGVLATYFTVTEVRVDGPGRPPAPPSAPTVIVGVVPLVVLGAAFTATFAFAVVRRARGKVQGAGSGWSALGTVLIVVAALAAAADVHFKLRLTEQYFGNAVSRERLGPAVHDFLEDGGLAKAALAAFSAGAVCVVLGRIRGGGWHVLRGVAACAALGLLVGFPLLHARELRDVGPGPQEILGWCLLLVASLIVLTWPARSAIVVAPSAVTEPREQAA